MADEKISQLSDAGAPQASDQFVVARSGSSLSMLWSAILSASGAVSSVFGRTGAVTAQTGDYTAAQVGALPSTETLDQIATANATAANVAMNSHKITGLTNGSAASDAAAFGQIPTALPPNGTAGGDLSGTHPNPAVKAITETSGPTDLVIGTITDGQFLKRTGSTLVSGAVMSNPLTTKGDIIIEDASPAPARLAIGATGNTLGVASGLPAWTFPPGYEIGYDQITAAVTVTSTTEATPTTLITCAAHTFDGAPVLLTVYSPFLSYASASGDSFLITLFESTTEITRLSALVVESAISATWDFAATLLLRFTPSAGSHTYLISANKTGGTMIFGAGNGSGAAYPPAFARFTKA